MLIAGGSGNNRGAILGPIVIWTIWSATDIVTSGFPPEWAVRAAFIRIFLIGLLLQVVLQAVLTRPVAGAVAGGGRDQAGAKRNR